MHRFGAYRSLILGITAAFIISGCAGAMASLTESVVGALEFKSVERQLNRAAMGAAIARTNASMLYDMPVSENAAWVDAISDDLSSDETERIRRDLMENDPYYATAIITDVIVAAQVEEVAPLFNTFIGPTPMTYVVENRLNVLYVEKPDIYALPESFSEYMAFKGATLKPVEATTGDVYPNVEMAILALLPITFKEDVDVAKQEFDVALLTTGYAKQELGDIEAEILANEKAGYPTSDLNDQKAVKEQEIEELEAVADEKEEIYFSLLDQATEAMERDFDGSKIALAKKLQKVTTGIHAGALQATTLFTVASIKLYHSYDILDEEIIAIAGAKGAGAIAGNEKLSRFIDIRIERLKNSALTLIPNIGVGLYQAVAQKIRAAKYDELVGTYIDMYETLHG